MASKEDILNKLQILITHHFVTPEKAYRLILIETGN